VPDIPDITITIPGEDRAAAAQEFYEGAAFWQSASKGRSYLKAYADRAERFRALANEIAPPERDGDVS
jgi:hypothetical protein